MAFLSGSTGVIYRQFSVTIVTAMLLSVAVAIMLTPALCAAMLTSRGSAPTRGPAHAFNRWFDRLTRHYSIAVRCFVRARTCALLLWAAVTAGCAIFLVVLPQAFLPDEDQGVLYVDVQLPPGATFERTGAVLAELERSFKEQSGAALHSLFSVAGWGFSGSGQGSAMIYVRLKDRDARTQSVFEVMERARAHAATIPQASIIVMAPPAVMELGTSSGFDLQLMDRSARGHDALMAARDILLAEAAQKDSIAFAYYSGQEDSEQYRLVIRTDRAGALGLAREDINAAIATWWGGEYVNDFSDRGRTKKVYVQAEPASRVSPDSFASFSLRNSAGEMVPFSSFLSVESVVGSPKLTRYQGVPAVNIQGQAAPGKSSGQAMRAMEEAAAALPPGFDTAWTGLSFQEELSGSQAPFLAAISLLVVFLCLAALYESWSIPLALAVPAGVIGALAGVFARGMYNDIYCQIALLTIAGLSAKNSILIVEFARQLHRGGMDLVQATVQAARLRLRPILMTSLCFILGVIPLAVSSGAGAGAQNALGTAVLAGMLSATALGLFFTPLFFILVCRLFCRSQKENRTG